MLRREVFLFISIFLSVVLTNYQVRADTTLTCEVIRVGGDHEKLKLETYENSFETIIINLETETITRIYKIDTNQFMYDYTIVVSDNQYLVGVENFTGDWVSMITVNLEKKVFNTIYLGYGGIENTLSVGQCS